MIELYLITVAVCIFFTLITGKILVGSMTVGDCLVTIVWGLLPVINVLLLCFVMWECWIPEEKRDKIKDAIDYILSRKIL